MIANDIDFLTDLQKSIWKSKAGKPKAGEIDGSVSNAVLNTVFDIVERNRLGVIIHNACMGFGVGITIYDNPVYPGVTTEAILRITNRHLGDGSKKFEDGWEVFYPFVKRNQDLLLEPLEDKHYYDY